MGELKYRLKIEHKDKGVGYTAKEALQNAQRQGHGPVIQAKMHTQPCSSGTEIEITVDDSMLTEALIQIVENSGRMPTRNGMYNIVEVLPIDQEVFEAEKADLEGKMSDLEKKVSRIGDENTSLKQELGNARRVIDSPLNACLAYFETLSFSSDMLLDDLGDISFARRVIGKDLENSFVNYVNHTLGRDYAEEEVTEILEFDTASGSGVIPGMQEAYDVAKSELAFLEKLRAGEVDMPESIMGDVIASIEAKSHQVTIGEYDSYVRSCSEKADMHQKLVGLKKKYDSFSEHLDLVEGGGVPLPVIFHAYEEGLQVFFPFRSRTAKSGLINDLKKELCNYFKTGDVSVMDHRFVGYDVNLSGDVASRVQDMVDDVPFTLRILGHDRITPYRLG